MASKALREAARALSAARKRWAGGRPRSDAPRCPCGAMTLKRAKARAHKCQASNTGAAGVVQLSTFGSESSTRN